jgi:phosphoglycolate phosphatase
MKPMSERVRAKNGFDWRDFNAYLFDIDGTLLNSRGQIHYYSFSAAMREVYGVEGTIDGVVWHGNTDVGILRSALAKRGVNDATFAAKREQALAVMRKEVEKNAARVEADLCPAIATLLKELDASGKLLGVSSGNLEIIGWVKLRAAKIADYFKFGSFSDLNDTRVEIFRHGATLAGISSKNDATKICFIGDTPSDIDAAHQLGLPVIAVATGIHSFEELASHEPELCLTCCEDLYPRS